MLGLALKISKSLFLIAICIGCLFIQLLPHIYLTFYTFLHLSLSFLSYTSQTMYIFHNSNSYQLSFKSHYFTINLQIMQSPDHPGENDNASNAKVYISNINKSIDQETLRKKFEEFGPIRSCILKKKTNDVTYSFIQYQKPADAADAITKLNGMQVWERCLKVQYGRGGKKGFQHYLTDQQRDRKFGEGRKMRQDSLQKYRKQRKYDRQARDQKMPYRRQQRQRLSRYSDSYSPERKRRSREGIRRNQRQAYYSRKQRFERQDSLDSYYRQKQYRRRDDSYRRSYRRSDSMESSGRRRSRERGRRYEANRGQQRYQRQDYQRVRRQRSRSREDRRRYNRQTPSYERQKQRRYSPSGKYRRPDRESSQKKDTYNDRVPDKYEKRLPQTRQRYEKQKKPQQRFLQKRDSMKDEKTEIKKQKYEPYKNERQIRGEKKYYYKQEDKYRKQSSQDQGTSNNGDKKVYIQGYSLRQYEGQPYENQRGNKYKGRQQNTRY